MPGWGRPGRQTTLLVTPVSLLGACPPLTSVNSSGITQPSSPANQCPHVCFTLTTQATGREWCVWGDGQSWGGQPGQFCNFPAQDPGPGRPPGAGQALRWPGRAQGDGTVPRVEAAWGHRGSSWPLTGGPGHNLPRPRPWQLLTLGSTRRGVLRLMKDFMMLPWGVEVGVMSIWFLCTVCRKVRRGRTTCRRDQRQAPGAGQTDQGQTPGGGIDRPGSDPRGRDRQTTDRRTRVRPWGQDRQTRVRPWGQDRQTRVRP